jgi:hypothetical protein
MRSGSKYKLFVMKEPGDANEINPEFFTLWTSLLPNGVRVLPPVKIVVPSPTAHLVHSAAAPHVVM